jgi:hypothetical protein
VSRTGLRYTVGMPLTQQDLAAIRMIVREEFAGLSTSGELADVPKDLEEERALLSDPTALLEAMGRSTVIAMRANATEAQRKHARDLEAYYQANYDTKDQSRARRLYRKGSSEPISIDEMNDALDRWRPTRRRRYEPIDEDAIKGQARAAAERMRKARRPPDKK